MNRRRRWLRLLPLLAVLVPVGLSAWSAVQRHLYRREVRQLRERTTADLIAEANRSRGDTAILSVIGQRQVSAGQFEPGLHTLALAMQVDATNPEHRIVLARAVYQVLGLQQGLMVLDEFLSLYPDTPVVVAMQHALKAEEALARRVLADAESEAAQARAIDPDFLEGRRVQAEVWRLQGRYDAAIRAAEETLAAYPDAAEVHLILGLARRARARSKGELEDARAALEVAARYADDLPHARRAEPLEAIGQIRLALDRQDTRKEGTGK